MNRILLLVFMLALVAGGASAANVTLDGAQTYQTIEGFGVNINAGWWNNGEVTPAIDLLVDQLGATLFRAVIEEMDWEATNDDASSNTFNWTYYNTVYTNTKFQGIWNTLQYLNQKGVTNGLVISFMGKGPDWMGAHTTIDTNKEDEFVETMASLLYYARNVKGIQFHLVSPLNETDTGGVEGPNMGAVQHARVLHKLAVKLDAIGMSDVRFVAAEAAGDFTGHFNAIVSDPVVMAKLAYWGVHQYGSDAGGYQGAINSSAYPNKSFWVTESAGFQNMLGMLDDNPTGNLVWDGFDSIYQHAIRAGRGSTPPNDSPGIDPPLIAYNTTTHLYTPRTSFYQHAQLFKFVRPGAQRLGITGSVNGLSPLEAYRNPTNGQFTIVGSNNNATPVTLQGTLAAVPGVAALDLFYTTATANLAFAGTFAVNGANFTATIPANAVFTLVSSSMTLSVALNSPSMGATFAAPALVNLAAVAFGGTNAVTKVEFFAGSNKIGSAVGTPYNFTWPNVPLGNYSLTARATDSAGLTVTSAPVAITVTTPAGLTVLGSTNDGSSTDTITDGTGAYINALRVQATSSSTVDQIRAKIGAISGRYQCAIYADNNGNATALLRASVPLTNVTAGWQVFPLSAPVMLTNGNFYWLAIWSDDVNARVYYTNSSGTLRWGQYPFGTWPDPVNLTDGGGFSYCLYVPGPSQNAFQQWKSNYGLAANTPANDDADQDGQPLLLEYALGLNPLATETNPPVLDTAQGNCLTLTYTKIKAATDITVAAEVADSLTGGWSSAVTEVEPLWQVIDGMTFETITARDKTPVTNATRRFMRLKVTQP